VHGLYVLDENGEVKPEPDVARWGRWLREHNPERTVARTELIVNGVPTVVSTVFLALDHSYHGGPPLLWETMILEGAHAGYLERHSTKYGALRSHEAVVRALRRGQFEPYAEDGPEIVTIARKIAAARWDEGENHGYNVSNRHRP
jgi:hypothetical protein